MPRKIRVPKGLSDRRAFKKDAAIQQLISKTPKEGAQWVEDNVNNLAEAKQALKFLVKAVIVLAGRI